MNLASRRAPARAPETKRAPSDALRLVSSEGAFEGYASLFGVADLARDVVAPGAFRASLARSGPQGVKLLWQHEAAQPIGAWLAIEEDGKGLFVAGRLNLSVARAREALALLSEGSVDGLSIGFRTRQSQLDKATGLRRLTQVDLWEISLVTFPMQPLARVAPRDPSQDARRRWRDAAERVGGALRG